jgi:DnaD/phage-associated family protein
MSEQQLNYNYKDDPEYLVPGNQRFSITPARSVSDAELSDSAFRTLGALGVFGDKNGWCWPGLARLAKMRHMSRQAISKHIQELRERGYVVTQARYDKQSGARKSNLSQIKFDYPLSTSEVEGDATSEVDTPSTPQVDTLSTSEVDVNALFNAPTNALKNEEAAASKNVMAVYQNNIGLLNPIMADVLADAEKTYSDVWVIAAIEEAVKSSARSWKYCESILSRWARDGFKSERPTPRGLKYPNKGDNTDFFKKLAEA